MNLFIYLILRRYTYKIFYWQEPVLTYRFLFASSVNYVRVLVFRISHANHSATKPCTRCSCWLCFQIITAGMNNDASADD